MLPMPCSEAAVISSQLSTKNPATGRECRMLRLGPSLCSSLPAHPCHNWTFLNPNLTFASTGHCSVASWVHPPGCKYWVSSLSYLEKTTCTGVHCKSQGLSQSLLTVFFRVSLPLSLLLPVIGLVSIKRSQSPFLIVLWVTACKWHHRGSLMGCNVSSLECSNVVPSLHEKDCQSPTRLHFSRHHLSISDFRRRCWGVSCLCSWQFA